MNSCINIILRRDGELDKLVTGFTLANPGTILCDNVITLPSMKITFFSSIICFITKEFLQKSELKRAYVLSTLAVVTNDAHSCFLTQVVLALIKYDFRVTDRSFKAKEASNLTFQLNLTLFCFLRQLRPVNVYHFCALE